MRPEHPVALITGASSGIGAATARALAREGFSLALGARRVQRLEALAAELAATHGTRCHVGPLDVTRSESVQAFVDGAVAALGAIHVLVNNAGLARGVARLESVTEPDWQAMFATNVEGVLRVTQAVLPHLRKAGWGHVVLLGSLAGHTPYEGGAVYCATKHAVKVFNEVLRLELNGEPIRVTSVDPGMVETEFAVVRLGDQAKADAIYRGMQPLTGDDIAECIRWVVCLPDHVNIDQILVKPRAQASATKVHRIA